MAFSGIGMKRQLIRHAVADDISISKATLTCWGCGEGKPQLASGTDCYKRQGIRFEDSH